MTKRQWLQLLGTRCAVSSQMTAKEAEAKLRSYLEGLTDIPDVVFCEESLEAASRQFDFFPAYAMLRKFAEVWHEELQRRAAPVLPGTDDPTLTREDQLILQVWQWRRDTNFSGQKFNEGQPVAVAISRGEQERRLTISLDVMRGAYGRIFRHICRTDLEAAAIAIRKGWEVETRPAKTEPTEEERAAVADSVARATGPMRHRTPPSPASPDDQADAVRQPSGGIVRSRADDRSLLEALRRDHRMPNRAVRIHALLDKLDLLPSDDDPPLPGIEAATSPPPPARPPADNDDEPWVPGGMKCAEDGSWILAAE